MPDPFDRTILQIFPTLNQGSDTNLEKKCNRWIRPLPIPPEAAGRVPLLRWGICCHHVLNWYKIDRNLKSISLSAAIVVLSIFLNDELLAQSLINVNNEPKIAQIIRPTPRQPELEPLPPLPPADELLKPSEPPVPSPEITPDDGSVTIVVKRFEVLGSTVFSAEELEAVLQPYLDRPLTLAELLEARSAVTQLYLDAGYITSGAYIPPQEPVDGVIEIQIIEGRVEQIQVTGNRRLRSYYVRDRLGLVTGTPLNVQRLVEGLRLLQLNPLIENISAELAAGVQPGTSILTVQVNEADSFYLDLFTDNNQSPVVGSWQRNLEINEGNLLGFGDRLNILYYNTNGSNEVDASYTVPLNPRNGTLKIRYDFNDSHVIEEPFDELDINSQGHYVELTFRQPIIETPTQELALSLTGSYQESSSEFLESLLGVALPFPSFGADEDGRIEEPAIRFAQEWLKRGSRDVLALRSEFSVGFFPSDTTLLEERPDDSFFLWRGQAQWVRLLAADTLLLLRSSIQLTGNALVPFEQFSLGGWDTVRGYRQDLFFTDNGVQASAEVRLPIYRAPRIEGALQGLLFLDAGVGWNVEQGNPDPNTLVGIGLGLQWQQSDRFNARIGWGIPLINVDSQGNSWQEQGVYFSVRYRLF